jgi:hypothetical protein
MLNESQRTALEALCDTVVPSIERDDDPHGHWGRKASDMMIAAAVEDLVSQIPDEVTRGGLLQLLDILDAQGLGKAPSQDSREQILRNITFASPDGAAGVGALVGMTLFIYYGAPDPQTGSNPNWATLGYSGPPGLPPQVPKVIETTVPEDGQTFEADAVVVGSGSGGGVIAGTLAKEGRKVVVVEASGYFNESDFTGFEMQAYQQMFWRGGPQPTADMNVSLQAGTTLGGGTTINWMNCLRTRPWVRGSAPRRRLPAVRRRLHRHSRGIRPLLRHDAGCPAGVAVTVRVPGDDLHQSGNAHGGPADRLSSRRHVRTRDHRAAARGEPGSPDAVQPSVECHRRARALVDRLPAVVRRDARARHVVHARFQCAGA